MDNWPTPEMIAEYEAERRLLNRMRNPAPIERAIRESHKEVASLLVKMDSHKEKDK
jgi:hypothetical protein